MSASRFGLLAVLLFASACQSGGDEGAANGVAALPPGMRPPKTSNADASPPAVPFDSATPVVKARAVASWPHDTMAYTEGLFVSGGRLFESTGVKGKSDFREVDLTTGRVSKRVPLANTNQFGEGISIVGDKLYQLTWMDGRGYVYDARTLVPVDSFTYDGEGWALTTDGTSLYMSDGSDTIRVIDPKGFRVTRTIRATEAGKSVYLLNELEWIDGELWANIYQTDYIVRLDPATGNVIGWVNVGGLLTTTEQDGVVRRQGVANGIAWDAEHHRVLVTGKMWPKVFAIEKPGSTRH